MKNIYKFYLLTFVLMSDFVLYAQPEDDDGGGGVENPGDPQPAPINSKLIILAIVGVLFVVYTYRNNRKTV